MSPRDQLLTASYLLETNRSEALASRGGGRRTEHNDRAWPHLETRRGGARPALETGGRAARRSRVEAIADDLPLLCRHIGRHLERQRLPPRVDEDEEVIVLHRRTVLADIGISCAIDEQRDAARHWVRPIRARHLRPRWREPTEIHCVLAGEVAPPAEHPVLAPQRDNVFRELQELAVDGRPVKPG